YTADYSAQNADNIALVTAGTLSGTFSSVTMPTSWMTNYTSTNVNLLYDTSTALKNNNIHGNIIINKNSITFLNTENAACVITDMTGRTVKRVIINNQMNSLSVNDLKGIYIIRITSEKVNFTQKVNF
ncbi:MAG: T9SS type A sorting domain-containing protein, partial [Paludibacter sp.]